MTQFDVVIVGLGATGSAALRELAKRGIHALGIERFSPGHDRGSSHGESRIIRLGYFEHPSYVPLLRRAYALWREFETAGQELLLHITGIAEIGHHDSDVVKGTLAASKLHNLPHDVLHARQTMQRFPAFRIPDDYICVFQPDGGYLAVEPAISEMVNQAQRFGAQIWPNTRAASVEPHKDRVMVLTDRGVIEARTAILTAGPWMPKLLPRLASHLRVTREVMAWFQPVDPEPLTEGRLPVFLIESRHGQHYGFPIGNTGAMKIAKHHHDGELADPDRPDRTVRPVDEALVRAVIADHVPSANGPLVAAKTCLYTVTPDHDFIVDRMPGESNVFVASPCSGHGFKFAPVLGEILADLAISGRTEHDISRFQLGRFG